MSRIPAQRISDLLPQVYKNLIPDLLNKRIPKEVLSTCNHCAKVYHPGDPKLSGHWYYLPDVKCCTFHPNLPNYLAGGLLADRNASAEGQRRIREKIRQRTGVTPFGIAPPAKFTLLYNHLESGSFGRTKSLLCPYYEKKDGTCTVWNFREATCATFFCKFVAGQDGVKFWTTLKEYLSSVQSSLVIYVLNRLGFDASAKKTEQDNQDLLLSREDLDDLPPDDKIYRSIWKNWIGREETFYLRSYELVTNLSSQEFQSIVDTSKRKFLHELELLRQQMIQPQIPSVLKVHPEIVISGLDNGEYLLATENGYYQVPAIVVRALKYFDGVRTNDEVVQQFDQDQDALLENDLIVYLYQCRILQAAGDSRERQPEISSEKTISR